jgi:hypothetical protein
MRRMAFAVVALIGWCATPARADTLPLIEGLPGTYVPGQQFTFTLRVPELPDFTSYSLELVFATDVTDPALLAFPTVAPADRYVFPTSANFGFQFNALPGQQEVRLTISDNIGFPGVFTTPGENDTLATITVNPGAGLTGPIRLSVGFNTQFDYNMEATFYDPPGNIPPIEQGTASENNPVPAPPGVVLLGLGGLLLGLRTRFIRRTA